MKKVFEWDSHPTKLEFKDFVPLGRTLKRGTSMRANHDSKHCQGDSESLTIRRTPAGIIFAKCFRCDRFGVFKKDSERVLPTRKVDGRWYKEISYETVENKKIELPKDMEMSMDNWPVEARSFVKKARIDSVVAFVRNIGYSPSLRKVVLPLYSNQVSQDKDSKWSNKLIGYQLRRVFEEDCSPKYTTRKNAKDYFAYSHKTDTVCCVVEDYLSFIRCSKFVSTVCLFGTSMSHSVMKTLAKYPKVVIFLDNDNNIVKKKQQQMQRELENWVDNVIIIKSDKQPKEYTDNDLIQAIELPL